jgi:hypothetical protein
VRSDRRANRLSALALGVAAAAAASVASPGEARAQYVSYGPFETYSPTLFREGPGFKVLGDGLVLHPGLATELGYDSNVLMSRTAGDAGVLRLRAHIDVATLSPQRLNIDGVENPDARPKLVFRFGAGVEYRQFFSRDFRVGTTQQVNASSDADLQIKPGDPLSLRIYNNFLVTNDARNLEIANSQTFAPRIYDRIGLLGTFRPRNGPLEIGLGESFRVDHYIQSDLSAGRALSNDVNLYGSLRVLPETLVKLEVRSSYVSFYGLGAAVPASVPLRIVAGVQSLLTSWLGASLYLGYGNSLHYGLDAVQLVGGTDGARYNNFVGGLEARLLLSTKLRLSAGWARDFFDSIYATYLRDDHLYLHYEQNLWRSLTVRSGLDVYLRQYGPLVPPQTLYYRAYKNGATSRSDVLVSFNAEATYRPLSWLETGISYSVLDDITDFGFVDGAGTRLDAAFVKHVLLFKVDLAY